MHEFFVLVGRPKRLMGWNGIMSVFHSNPPRFLLAAMTSDPRRMFEGQEQTLLVETWSRASLECRLAAMIGPVE